MLIPLDGRRLQLELGGLLRMSSMMASPGAGRPRGNGSVRVRLLAFLEACRNSGRDWPVRDEIARELGVSKSTVRHHLAVLETQGIVVEFTSTMQVPCFRVRLVENGPETGLQTSALSF